ncbi:MAG: cytochrome [Rickettsiales bacterium]|jgi:cytochrome c|nr:cytochrome [Rickettsiales bacterium]
MSNLEFNKIAAGVLVAGLFALGAGKAADIFYHPEEPKTRGFSVEVAEEATGEAGGAAEVAPVTFDVAALMAAADAAEGEKVFKKCAACHTVEPGGPNRVGPNLSGVVGAPKAHHAGFTYSDALKTKGGIWDKESLFTFLHKPKAFVPGTKMGFAGIKDPKEIANVVAYLEKSK